MTVEDSLDFLKSAGAGSDGSVDIALAALHLAALGRPGLLLGRYENHLRQTGEEVTARMRALRDAGGGDDVRTRLAALKHVIADMHGFSGEKDDYDNIENADLTRVIDKRRGLPIALAILYIDAARRQGWIAEGLNLPGHFVLRLDHKGDRIIFDPFNDCKILQAPHLREIVKTHLGPQAELSATYFEPAGNRQILLRLQNNIKLRQINGEDYSNALKTVEAMRLVDPGEYRLLFDSGVLRARTGQVDAAIRDFEAYMAGPLSDKERHDTALILQHIRNSLA